jgi:hypothetical protein
MPNTDAATNFCGDWQAVPAAATDPAAPVPCVGHGPAPPGACLGEVRGARPGRHVNRRITAASKNPSSLPLSSPWINANTDTIPVADTHQIPPPTGRAAARRGSSTAIKYSLFMLAAPERQRNAANTCIHVRLPKAAAAHTTASVCVAGKKSFFRTDWRAGALWQAFVAAVPMMIPVASNATSPMTWAPCSLPNPRK